MTDFEVINVNVKVVFDAEVVLIGFKITAVYVFNEIIDDVSDEADFNKEVNEV